MRPIIDIYDASMMQYSVWLPHAVLHQRWLVLHTLYLIPIYSNDGIDVYLPVYAPRTCVSVSSQYV